MARPLRLLGQRRPRQRRGLASGSRRRCPTSDTPVRVRCARLRFQIIGTKLAAPPDDGELRLRLTDLAARACVQTPDHRRQVVRILTKSRSRSDGSTQPQGATDPIAILGAQDPWRHAGNASPRTFPQVLAEAIARLYRDHPRWSFQLHYDKSSPRRSPARTSTSHRCPADATVRAGTCGRQQGCCVLETSGKYREGETRGLHATRETRSYEVAHVHGLWHLDFHQGLPRAVLTKAGQWKKPQLLGILDDRSAALLPTCSGTPWTRPPNHWCTASRRPSTNAACLARCSHRQRRRHARRRDRGGARASRHRSSTRRFRIRLSKMGKQESFWGQIEGRLLPMPSKDTSLENIALELLQHRDPGMGRGGVPPQGAPEIKEDAARTLPARLPPSVVRVQAPTR